MKKLVRHNPPSTSTYMPVASQKQLYRESFFSPAFYDDGKKRLDSACLGCSDKPCIHIANEKLGVLNVCPVNAIGISSQDGSIFISNDCIRCGLCVHRCPFGAVFCDERLNPRVEKPSDGFRSCSFDEFSEFTTNLRKSYCIPEADGLKFVSGVKEALSNTGQQAFYPFIANMFTQLGFPASANRQGDTSNRIDVCVIDDVASIPIEVKSPTEVPYINIKAIRQALENKVVLLGRELYPTCYDTTSVVLGYDYPNERSDVAELIEDIHNAFGFNIGVVSLDSILRLVYLEVLNDCINKDNLREILIQLRGYLSEASI